MKKWLLLLAIVTAGCGQKSQSQQSAAPQPVEVALEDAGSGAHTPHPAAVLPVVKNFSVTPQTARPGQPVTASVEVAAAAPDHTVTLAWFGPDGWLISDEEQSLSSTTLKFQPPTLNAPGVYQAELRDTRTATPLASAAITVGS